MKILAHRGYWNDNIVANSKEALEFALERGFGFESDLRDYCGELVISHNIADSDSFAAQKIFVKLKEFKDEFCFAINVKSDGLIELLKKQLKANGITNYFTFDMSVPQMVEYRDAGITFFTRQSEYEREPIMYKEAAGVWIDGFNSTDWITFDLIRGHLDNKKKVCIVSPDLHKREYLSFWTKLKDMNLNEDGLMICTDYPEEAKIFFEK